MLPTSPPSPSLPPIARLSVTDLSGPIRQFDALTSHQRGAIACITPDFDRPILCMIPGIPPHPHDHLCSILPLYPDLSSLFPFPSFLDLHPARWAHLPAFPLLHNCPFSLQTSIPRIGSRHPHQPPAHVSYQHRIRTFHAKKCRLIGVAMAEDDQVEVTQTQPSYTHASPIRNGQLTPTPPTHTPSPSHPSSITPPLTHNHGAGHEGPSTFVRPSDLLRPKVAPRPTPPAKPDRPIDRDERAGLVSREQIPSSLHIPHCEGTIGE